MPLSFFSAFLILVMALSPRSARGSSVRSPLSSVPDISRLSTRLTLATSNNRETPDMGTRHLGGSFRHNHPYISGYFYAMFHLPEGVFGEVTEQSCKWLSSTCESFTPPQLMAVF